MLTSHERNEEGTLQSKPHRKSIRLRICVINSDCLYCDFKNRKFEKNRETKSKSCQGFETLLFALSNRKNIIEQNGELHRDIRF